MKETNVGSSALVRHAQERAQLMVSRWLTPGWKALTSRFQYNAG